jgi:hypothetical protein
MLCRPPRVGFLLILSMCKLLSRQFHALKTPRFPSSSSIEYRRSSCGHSLLDQVCVGLAKNVGLVELSSILPHLVVHNREDNQKDDSFSWLIILSANCLPSTVPRLPYKTFSRTQNDREHQKSHMSTQCARIRYISCREEIRLVCSRERCNPTCVPPVSYSS